MMRVAPAALIVAMMAAAGLAGCGGGGGGSSSTPSGGSTSTSATASIQIPPSALSALGPSFDGYTPTFWYPANNADPNNEPSAVVTVSTTALTGLPSPQPTGTQLLNVTFRLTAAVTFQGCPYFSPVTIPSYLVTAGRTFYESTYDLTTHAVMNCNPTSSSLNGLTLTFSGFPEPPVLTTLTLNSTDIYAAVLSYQ